MAKIGILFGAEDTFPWALIDRINGAKVPGVEADSVKIGPVAQGQPAGYAVILDRISQDVPFYRSFLKNEALCGTQVINDPLASADDKFFENCLATTLGIAVPKTVMLPHKNLPPGTTVSSMRNLVCPLDWDSLIAQIGFPAYLKRNSGCGGGYVFKVRSKEELFEAYAKSDGNVMMLQEAIEFESYFRCFCINREHVRVMPYDPRGENGRHYPANRGEASPALRDRLVGDTLTLNRALGYDMNTCEFAMRRGVPIAIDFMNWAPDCDRESVGEANFAWVVDATAKMLLERVKAPRTESYWTSRPPSSSFESIVAAQR